jgi:hypothetical protein
MKRVLAGAAFLAASAVAFAGYLQPAMLVQFANILLCG